MKANEFVKKHGLNKAKVLLSTQGKTIANLKSEYTAEQLREYQGYIVSNDLMSLVELKRLVESHELVETWKLPEDDENGLDGATLYLECYAFYSTDEEKAKLDRLAQAIADVESCMEVSSESN